MKKITDTQKYAILWLNHTKNDAKSIAKSLKISEDQIIDFLSSHKPSEPGSLMKNLMITESVGQKHQVSVMTKAASEVSDHQKQKLSQSNPDKTSFIFKPNQK